MRRTHIFGILVLALICAGCGEEAEDKAMRNEIANLNKYLNNLQTRLDQRETDVAELRQFMQKNSKEPHFVRAQEQLQDLEKKLIASERTTLNKMSGLEEKLKTTRQTLANTNKQLAEQEKLISTHDQEHDDVDETLIEATKEMTTEAAAEKNKIKDIRKELRALKSVVEKQTFQLLHLQQTEELEKTGVTPQ